MSHHNKYLIPGSYSHGTLRTEELIETFLDLLRTVGNPRTVDRLEKEYLSALGEIRCTTDIDGVSRKSYILDEILHELFDRLQDYCPPGFHFGSSEGDGADFGVWLSSDYWSPNLTPVDALYEFCLLLIDTEVRNPIDKKNCQDVIDSIYELVMEYDQNYK